jgi:excisionase family DNA binding protein
VNFEKLLTDADVAEMLGLHRKTVQRMARTGTLRGYRLGRYWRFRVADVEALVCSLLYDLGGS